MKGFLFATMALLISVTLNAQMVDVAYDYRMATAETSAVPAPATTSSNDVVDYSGPQSCVSGALSGTVERINNDNYNVYIPSAMDYTNAIKPCFGLICDENSTLAIVKGETSNGQTSYRVSITKKVVESPWTIILTTLPSGSDYLGRYGE